MAGLKRKSFQGVANIIRFNWHLYAVAFLFSALLIYLSSLVSSYLSLLILLIAAGIMISTIVSLVVSYYVYDFSSFYSLNWLDKIIEKDTKQIVNIHAGFDETSELLLDKFPGAALTVYDFYDAEKHTEVSIKRARKAYSTFPGTVAITTDNVPFKSNSVDCCLLVFAAHEIRNDEERKQFFTRLAKALKQDGSIVVTEHLRDSYNLLAYNIGYLHFLSETTWKQTFSSAGLQLTRQFKINPFVTTFILSKNGMAA